MKVIKHLLHIYDRVDSNHTIMNKHVIFSDAKLFPIIQTICPPHSRYIKHFLEQEWEENYIYEPYIYEGSHETARKVVPYGDMMLYLVVYYEEDNLIPEPKRFQMGNLCASTGSNYAAAYSNVSGIYTPDYMVIGSKIVWDDMAGKWVTF